mmetsp:Transcript_71950/g.142755  ORF Transcript_71950/g.142755 Transcript_71950/m.142755 type:complete len:956 (+) Transcript_71950:103-2970(+)|eukprot:CAMPEP_0172669512 /NCGR_PEP_ID=MMETSP1074-20121228/9725_1 /TAXON_ID=2916 /ORGANISM="Ceratium fusus, Strain PA161109" /LENGTH=955 /DNA_ID=CAMNT_0013486297 /DNA_START=88 /DNA_END=2955 /DNA_ORIENTATION=+
MIAFNVALFMALLAACGLKATLAARGPRAATKWTSQRGNALMQENISAGENRPPKGLRQLGDLFKEKEDKMDHFEGKMGCQAIIKVNSTSSKKADCPSGCPYFAQDKTDDQFCTFKCVKNAEECVKMNPKTPIADKESGTCRSPLVESCREYNYDGTDTCKVCNTLYALAPDGKCYTSLKYVVYGLGVVLIVVGVLIVVWMIDLFSRPNWNEEVLQKAQEFRSHQKLRTSAQDGRQLWPLTTNLLYETPAGAGMLLHFNFQFMVILWGLVVALVWFIMATVIDHAMFILGTRNFGTPRNNCILVAWGYETQQRLMWTKVLFCQVIYVFTFIGSLLMGIRQLRLFQDSDYQNKTMKDFVLMCDGLPRISGEVLVEEELKKSVESATGTSVVSVSVAWDHQEHQETILKYLENDMVLRDPHLKAARMVDTAPPDMNPIRKAFFSFEQAILVEESEEPELPAGSEMRELCLGMTTSPCAFVVFNTEKERDTALEAFLQNGGMAFQDTKLQFSELLSEPDTVEWYNYGHSSPAAKFRRLCLGFVAIFLGLVFWSVAFYAPYAWSVMTFNYDNGQQPGFIYGLSFSMVVVVGNQIMYEICARVSDFVGFRFSDTKAVCYMILFCMSCLYNVLVDMATTYYIAEQVMEELGFRTYFGKKLSEIDSFTEKFETYAMQRNLAENTYRYAFPATYLIPFLIEPVVTIYVPLVLGSAIVGSHPEVGGRDAEGWVAAIPMDMGRYADIVLNMLLGVLIFYFPGGWTHSLFFALAGSHVFIYIVDHCRLLRSVPSITVATMEVDWWAQAMVAPVCGIVLSSMVFKANCQEYGYCIQGMPLVGVCAGAFFAHTVVHFLLLVYVVPLFGKAKPEIDPCKDQTFKDVAAKMPCSWFTTNPVHCLRSEHVYNHSPPCRFWFSGKEHMLEVNEKAGCYFSDKIAESEDFTSMHSISHGLKSLKSFRSQPEQD